MNQNNVPSKSPSKFELILTGCGYVDSIAEMDGNHTCVVTALHGAKEDPEELTIHCDLPKATAEYIMENRAIYIEGNQPISFVIEDFTLQEVEGNPVIRGSLTKASNVKPEKMQYCKTDPYLDLHLKGCGYANRIRFVKPGKSKKGRKGGKTSNFWATTISAMYGDNPKENHTYTRVDCRVNGSVAHDRIEELYERFIAGNNNCTVFVGFTIGDIYLDSWVNKESGQEIPILKGRLLKLPWAKVNRKKVFFSNRPPKRFAQSA